MLDKNGFDLWSDGYESQVSISDDGNTYPFAGYKEVLGTIFTEIAPGPGKTVLDIGFGTGTLTAKLYEKGCAVYGQDFSDRMVETALARMPGAGLYKGDFTEGLVDPLMDNRYDSIVATYSLHHLTDEQKVPFMRSLLSLLKENGRLIIGDIAFRDREQMDKCRIEAGHDWDEEEYYFVADEMKEHFPGMEFEQISFCAGIITIKV